MKKSFILAFAAAIVLVSSVAEARDGFYLTARGGMTWNHLNSKEDSVATGGVSDVDSVGVFGAAIGYKYGFFRGEFEFVNRKDAEEDIKSGSIVTSTMTVSSTSYMLNGYIDFMPNYWISPYVSAGIGFSDLQIENDNVGFLYEDESYDDFEFTWQIGGGLTLRINRCLNIDGGYRYYTLGKVEGAEVNTHEWYAGIRFTF